MSENLVTFRRFFHGSLLCLLFLPGTALADDTVCHGEDFSCLPISLDGSTGDGGRDSKEFRRQKAATPEAPSSPSMDSVPYEEAPHVPSRVCPDSAVLVVDPFFGNRFVILPKDVEQRDCEVLEIRVILTGEDTVI